MTLSLDSGSLPPGLNLGPNGALTGTATTNGTFPFAVRATDSSPSQTATASEQIVVVDPLTITTPPTWPDACQNQPYTFTVHTSGGATPIIFTYSSGDWPTINMTSPGVFTGTPTVLGTFTLNLNAIDATGVVPLPPSATQVVSLTVKTCP